MLSPSYYYGLYVGLGIDCRTLPGYFFLLLLKKQATLGFAGVKSSHELL